MTPISVLEQFDQIVMEMHGMDVVDTMVVMKALALEKLVHTHAAVHVHYNK